MGPQAARLSSLRQVLASMAENGRQRQWRPQKVLLGLAALDEALGGGLARGTLHEIAAASEADLAAATTFAVALAVRSPGPVVSVSDDRTLGETGVPYGPWLEELGLAPERLVWVAAQICRRCCGRGGPWVPRSRHGDHRDPEPTAGTQGNACDGAGGRPRGALGLVMRCQPYPSPSAVATRWRVRPAAAGERGCRLIGPARVALWLTRNRWGLPEYWELEWDGVDRSFDLASAARQSLAQTALDRSRQAAIAHPQGGNPRRKRSAGGGRRARPAGDD